MRYQTEISSYFDRHEEEMIAQICRLVAIPSTRGEPAPGKPFGEGPAQALETALETARALGLSAENLEGYVGVVDLNDAETALHILAHLDVVPAGPGWTVTEAFTPLRKDGLLYGRGTDDDKGPLVAALFAMKAIRDLGIPLRKNVRLIMGTDEESGFADIQWYYKNHPYAPYTFSPDAGFPVTNLEKGHYQPTFRRSWPAETALPRVTAIHGGARINVVPPEAQAKLAGLTKAEVQPSCDRTAAALGVRFTLTEEADGLRVECHGLGSHASTPEEGRNALTALLELLLSLPLADCAGTQALRSLARLLPHGDTAGQALGIACTHPLSGPLTLAFSMLDLTDTELVGRFDSRTPLERGAEQICAPTQAAFTAAGFSIEGTLDPPHYVPEDSDFIRTLLSCYTGYTGLPGECLATGGGTYVHGIPGGVAFGASLPGFDSGLHGPDERVRLADLLVAGKIFAQVIVSLCGAEA